MTFNLDRIADERKRRQRAPAAEFHRHQPGVPAQRFRKTRPQHYHRLSRKDVQIIGAFDHRTFPFEYQIVCENDRMARQLCIFGQIESICYIRALERSNLMSHIPHFRHSIECGLQLLRPPIAKQLFRLKRDTLIKQQLAPRGETLSGDFELLVPGGLISGLTGLAAAGVCEAGADRALLYRECEYKNDCCDSFYFQGLFSFP